MTEDQCLQRIGEFLATMFPAKKDHRPNWNSSSYKPELWKLFVEAHRGKLPITGEVISLEFQQYNHGDDEPAFTRICNAWDEWQYAAERQ